MKTRSALGLLAGGFLLLPKRAWVLTLIWSVAKVQPVAGMSLFGLWLMLERRL